MALHSGSVFIKVIVPVPVLFHVNSLHYNLHYLFSYPAPHCRNFHHHFRFPYSTNKASSCFVPGILADLFSELGRHYHLDDFEQLPSSCSFSISSESPPTTSTPTSPVLTPCTPVNMAYQQSGPTFSFCGTFSGAGNVSAARWIKRLEHELSGYKVNGVINPSTYLDSLNMLLTDDAAEWAESHPEAIRLLAIEEPTAQDLANFRSLLCERFPTKAVEISRSPLMPSWRNYASVQTKHWRPSINVSPI